MELTKKSTAPYLNIAEQSKDISNGLGWAVPITPQGRTIMSDRSSGHWKYPVRSKEAFFWSPLIVFSCVLSCGLVIYLMINFVFWIQGGLL